MKPWMHVVCVCADMSMLNCRCYCQHILFQNWLGDDSDKQVTQVEVIHPKICCEKWEAFRSHETSTENTRKHQEKLDGTKYPKGNIFAAISSTQAITLGVAQSFDIFRMYGNILRWLSIFYYLLQLADGKPLNFALAYGPYGPYPPFRSGGFPVGVPVGSRFENGFMEWNYWFS